MLRAQSTNCFFERCPAQDSNLKSAALEASALSIRTKGQVGFTSKMMRALRRTRWVQAFSFLPPLFCKGDYKEPLQSQGHEKPCWKSLIVRLPQSAFILALLRFVCPVEERQSFKLEARGLIPSGGSLARRVSEKPLRKERRKSQRLYALSSFCAFSSTPILAGHTRI